MKILIIIIILFFTSSCKKNSEELVRDTIPFVVKQFKINDNDITGEIKKINVINDYYKKDNRIIETIIYLDVDGLDIESHINFTYINNNLINYDYLYNIKNIKDIPSNTLNRVLDKYPSRKINSKKCTNSCLIKYDVSEKNKYLSYDGDISVDAKIDNINDKNNEFDWIFNIDSNISISHNLTGLYNNEIMEMNIINDLDNKIVASGIVKECNFDSAYDITCNSDSCEFNIICNDVYTIKVTNDRLLVNDILLNSES